MALIWTAWFASSGSQRVDRKRRRSFRLNTVLSSTVEKKSCKCRWGEGGLTDVETGGVM